MQTIAALGEKMVQITVNDRQAIIFSRRVPVWFVNYSKWLAVKKHVLYSLMK